MKCKNTKCNKRLSKRMEKLIKSLEKEGIKSKVGNFCSPECYKEYVEGLKE